MGVDSCKGRTNPNPQTHLIVILRLAVLIQYRSVTDRRTYGRKDGHTTTAYTALYIALRGKNIELLVKYSTRVERKKIPQKERP